MPDTLKIISMSVAVLVLSGSCFSSGEQFWPCGHELNATKLLNVTEILGDWVITATMDDLSHKKELVRCDKVTFHELNETHLLMTGYNQFHQQNITVVIRNVSDPGKWEMPEIDGGAVVVDLDPGISLTISVCYRPLRFWWLAVLTREPVSPANADAAYVTATSSRELEMTTPEGAHSLPPTGALKSASGRLWKMGIDLEEASLLSGSDC